MSLEVMSKILVGLGLVVLAYAFNMGVSVEGSRIVNLHLISERQNTLTIGGIVFLAGIILFAVAKLKQTPAEDEHDKSQQRHRAENAKAATESAKVAVGDAYAQTTQGMAALLLATSLLWRRFFVAVEEGWQSILIRLTVGLVVGLTTSVFVGNFFFWSLYAFDINRTLHHALESIAENLTVLSMLLYSLRARPMLHVLKRIFLVSLGLIAVDYFYILVLHDGQFNTVSAYVTPILSAAGLIVVYVAQLKQRPE